MNYPTDLHPSLAPHFKTFFFLLNAALVMAILNLILRVHLPSFVNMLSKYLKLSTFSRCFWPIGSYRRKNICTIYGTERVIISAFSSSSNPAPKPADKITQDYFETCLYTVRVLHYLAKCGSTVATPGCSVFIFIFIYSVFQTSTAVDTDLVIIMTVGTVQNEY
jgi:hypothetical protein